MKHTQGIWKVAKDGYSIYSESACENIYQPCKNFNMITPSQTLKANARLIASAPELLEALKEITNFCDDNIFQTPLMQKYINQSRDVINKAGGNQ